MSLTALALRGPLWLSPLQSGRGIAEGLFVLFLLSAVTSVLAYRGIGGQLVRLANLVLVLLLVVALVFVVL